MWGSLIFCSIGNKSLTRNELTPARLSFRHGGTVCFSKVYAGLLKKKHWFFGLLDIYDFSCNLVVISTSKFFNDNKIAWARRASEICSLWMRFVVFFMYITMTYYQLEIIDTYSDFGPENSYRFPFTMHFFTFLFAELMLIGWVVVPKKKTY